MTEIVDHVFSEGEGFSRLVDVFHHLVDVSKEDLFVEKELPSLCETQEKMLSFLKSLKEVEVWPCRLQKIVDVAIAKGFTPPKMDTLYDTIQRPSKHRGGSSAIGAMTMGATDEKIQSMISDAKQCKLVIELDDGEYMIYCPQASIKRIVMKHCNEEHEPYRIVKL
jgi:hypothetical protein